MLISLLFAKNTASGSAAVVSGDTMHSRRCYEVVQFYLDNLLSVLPCVHAVAILSACAIAWKVPFSSVAEGATVNGDAMISQL